MSSNKKTTPIVKTALLGPESVGFSRVTSTVGLRGMVVSDDRLASEWGAEILRKGGNAIDAAVGTAFVLAVTRPHFATLGGGGFLLYKKSSHAGTVFNFRETSPQATLLELYQHRGTLLRDRLQNGALACGTPGNVSGYLGALDRFGTKKRTWIMSRAIELARQGFPVTAHMEKAALQRWAHLNSTAKNTFGDGTVPHPPGTRLKQLDLARTLERISQGGIAGFYTGLVAKKLTRGIQAAGGILCEHDLESYQTLTHRPLSSSFLNWKILTAPLPSVGGGLLLKLLHHAKLAEQAGKFKRGFGAAATIQSLTQIMELGFQTLTLPQSNNTTHLSVVDPAGNAVALSTTINDHFGSGFMPPGTGILMNSVMDDFTADPQVPNLFELQGGPHFAIAPHKRPLSCMTPTLAEHPSGELLVLGGAGGPRIITAVFQCLLNRIVFQMSLGDAISAPRLHHQWKPEILRMEKFGFAPEVKHTLKKAGYTLDDSVPSLGRVFGITRTPDERTHGIADPRSEGAAV